MIECPKCGSKNTTQASSDNCVCQDCFNVFPHSSVQKKKVTQKNHSNIQKFIFPFFLGGIAALFLTIIVSKFFSTNNNQSVVNNSQTIPLQQEATPTVEKEQASIENEIPITEKDNSVDFQDQAVTPPPEIEVSYQETRNAVDQLNAFRSKLDIGLNMIGYAQELGNVNAAVDSAIREHPSSDNAARFRKIIDTYKVALELWRCDLETNFFTKCRCQNDAYEQKIFNLHPDIAAKVKPHKDVFDGGGYQYLVDHQKVLQLLWLSADIETSRISNIR